MKPLFVPLKAEYFDQFESGNKSWEHRKIGPRWNHSTVFIGREVTLSYGYGKKKRMTGVIVAVRVKFNKSKAFVSCYGKPDHCISFKINLTGKVENENQKRANKNLSSSK